ncbi:hypothetical protein AU468_03680 [Alkalispirochaeta sphaeroplastigenens]|uniref:Spore coat protein U domain-containing protein n=1 Tax=Alkalispirochaeta sphaeroplastigenens TaxID=1187066 RepID=A0A2S4JX45_9SPIO|nr:hypothetical protein [Alkalispirochaeta sphaeroplastigenens]POR04084.1 hypothetical protein AU468_03680 [Alkalispirochaeta sphaeroplastigenens]
MKGLSVGGGAVARGAVVLLILFLPRHLPAGPPGPARLEFVSLPSSVTVDNPIFSPAEGTLEITIGHRGGAAGYVVTASSGRSGSFAPRVMAFQGILGILFPGLDYNLYTPDNEILRDFPGSLSRQEVLWGNFGNSGSSLSTQTRTVTVRVPPDQFVRRGAYHDRVVFSLYRGRSPRLEELVLVERRAVAVQSVTPTVAQIRISGQHSYEMNFHQLAPGQRQSAVLEYRANVGFRIEASSQHGGVLANQTVPGGEPIPYQLRLRGLPVNLSRPGLVDVNLLFGTTREFETIPLEVTIGSFGQVTPGRFEDVITFTISAF